MRWTLCVWCGSECAESLSECPQCGCGRTADARPGLAARLWEAAVVFAAVSALIWELIVRLPPVRF